MRVSFCHAENRSGSLLNLRKLIYINETTTLILLVLSAGTKCSYRKDCE